LVTLLCIISALLELSSFGSTCANDFVSRTDRRLPGHTWSFVKLAVFSAPEHPFFSAPWVELFSLGMREPACTSVPPEGLPLHFLPQGFPLTLFFSSFFASSSKEPCEGGRVQRSEISSWGPTSHPSPLLLSPAPRPWIDIAKAFFPLAAASHRFLSRNVSRHSRGESDGKGIVDSFLAILLLNLLCAPYGIYFSPKALLFADSQFHLPLTDYFSDPYLPPAPLSEFFPRQNFEGEVLSPPPLRLLHLLYTMRRTPSLCPSIIINPTTLPRRGFWFDFSVPMSRESTRPLFPPSPRTFLL